MSKENDENDPKIRDSRHFPDDKDFGLADQNRKLKDVIKVMADSLRNGEKIAEEGVRKLQTELSENKRNNFVSSLLGIGVIILGCLIAYQFGKERSNQESENRPATVSKRPELPRPIPDQKASVRYWQDRARDLKAELKKLADAPASLKEANLREQLEKLEAEKTELEKKLTPTKAESGESKLEQYKDEAHQILAKIAYSDEAKKKEAQLREQLTALKAEAHRMGYDDVPDQASEQASLTEWCVFSGFAFLALVAFIVCASKR